MTLRDYFLVVLQMLEFCRHPFSLAAKMLVSTGEFALGANENNTSMYDDSPNYPSGEPDEPTPSPREVMADQYPRWAS